MFKFKASKNYPIQDKINSDTQMSMSGKKPEEMLLFLCSGDDTEEDTMQNY